jgi:hypothetical protein
MAVCSIVAKKCIVGVGTIGGGETPNAIRARVSGVSADIRAGVSGTPTTVTAPDTTP